MIRRKVTTALATTIGLAAMAIPLVSAPGAFAADHSFTLKTSSLGALPDTAIYEAWAIEGDTKHRAGTFNVDDGKNRVRLSSPVPASDIDKIAVTIEPTPDPDPANPSGVVVLVGDLNAKGKAKLALPLDLKKVSGSAILATPTDDEDNNEAGVWFLDPAGPAASLNVPVAPSGWKWEGWGATQGVPLSTGRFSDPAAGDEAAPFSGDNAAPPFPGEDFVRNLPSGVGPVNLADGASSIVLSLEPDIDGVDPTGDGPFFIKPLIASVDEGQPGGTSFKLKRDRSRLVTASVSFDRVAPAKVVPPFYRGYATVAAPGANTSVVAYRWTHRGWKRSKRADDQRVYVAPFGYGYSWTWDRSGGWKAVQSRHLTIS